MNTKKDELSFIEFNVPNNNTQQNDVFNTSPHVTMKNTQPNKFSELFSSKGYGWLLETEDEPDSNQSLLYSISFYIFLLFSSEKN